MRHSTRDVFAALARTALFAFATFAVGASVAKGQLPLDDVRAVFFCSNSGRSALGSADAFQTAGEGIAGDLRYWEYDPATRTGTTTPFPPAAPEAAFEYCEVIFPRGDVGLVYFTAFDDVNFVDVAYAWDVPAGTIAQIDFDMCAKCCADDGSIAYAIGFNDSFPYKVELVDRATATYTVTNLGTGVFDPTAFVDELKDCSSDGSILYGEVTSPTPMTSGEHLFVYDDSAPSLIYLPQYSGPTATLYDGKCSPDGQTCVLDATDDLAEETVLYADTALNFDDFPDLLDEYFEPEEVADSGLAYGALVSQFLESPGFVQPNGSITKVPLPDGTNVGRLFFGTSNADQLFGVAFDLTLVNPTVSFRYTVADGSTEGLADVFQYPDFSFVRAMSSDGTTAYASVRGSELVEFFVEGEPFDFVGPVVQSATVSIDGNSLTLVFDESVTQSVAPTLALSGGAATGTYQNGDGTNAISYALSRTIESGETGTYELAAAAVEDAAGNPNALQAGVVLNNSTAVPDVTPPTVVSATIDPAGQTLTIVFDENAVELSDPTLDLSDGAVTATYDSGSGTTAIRYALSRIVVLGEAGTYSLAAGAVEDAAGNPIAAISGDVTNESTQPGDPPPAKTESRPYGAIANYYIDAAFQQASGIFTETNTWFGYYAYVYAYYSVVYGNECGDSFEYDGAAGLTRSEALNAYKQDRYAQVLFAYYAQYYALEDFKSTYNYASLYTYYYAYYSYAYGVEDLNAE